MAALAALLILAALVAVPLDRYGRKKPTRRVKQTRPGRPVQRRVCGCPTHQHRRTCHHANTNGPTRGFVDAEKRRQRRAARAAAKAERTRRARVAEVKGQDLGPWLPAVVAQTTVEGVILSRMSDRCEVCECETRHLVSMADIHSGHEPARVVCAGCSYGLR